MGVDLEKKRKLLLYPIEYQRGCPMRVGFGICQGRRLCRLRTATVALPLGPGWARAHGQRGAKPLSKCVICQYNRQRSNYKD